MRMRFLICGVLAAAAGGALVQAHGQAQGDRPEAAMAAAARSFLQRLEPARREKAVFPFNSEERLNWHFIPRERKGLPLKEMTPAEREAALALLRAGLSEMGFKKTAVIRELEIVLHHQENRSPRRDPDLYYFTVFGEPADSGTWGWRYEGHHCSLNWTVVRGRSIASTPQFFGSNPAEVKTEVAGAPKPGTRALSAEEDLARTLVLSLNEEQKKEAVLAKEVPMDIITGAQRQASIQAEEGIPYGKLSTEQQGMLAQLVREYAGAQPQMLARQRLQAIRQAGLERVKFAWIGPTGKNQRQYYRVQGPTFLIEYDNTSGNHIHCVWRDFKGDFGMDLLAMHHRAHPHRVAAAK